MNVQPCPECGNEYLAIRTDIYKDKREFVYCDCCGAMATLNLWNKTVGSIPTHPTANQASPEGEADDLPVVLYEFRHNDTTCTHYPPNYIGIESLIAKGHKPEPLVYLKDVQRKYATNPAAEVKPEEELTPQDMATLYPMLEAAGYNSGEVHPACYANFSWTHFVQAMWQRWRLAGLEAAAMHCDELAKLFPRDDVAFDKGYTMAVQRAAREIREMKPKLMGGEVTMLDRLTPLDKLPGYDDPLVYDNYSVKDYHCAVAGEGPKAYEWQDKPHRLVYDLCRALLEKNYALKLKG